MEVGEGVLVLDEQFLGGGGGGGGGGVWDYIIDALALKLKSRCHSNGNRRLDHRLANILDGQTVRTRQDHQSGAAG